MMEELKPCRACGEDKINIMCEHYGNLHGCLIGCLNINCDDEPVVCFALSKEKAERKARRKWNRRVSHD